MLVLVLPLLQEAWASSERPNPSEQRKSFIPIGTRAFQYVGTRAPAVCTIVSASPRYLEYSLSKEYGLSPLQSRGGCLGMVFSFMYDGH